MIAVGVLVAVTAAVRVAVHGQGPETDAHVHPRAEQDAVESMTGEHHHDAALAGHMKLTPVRPPNDADRQRADVIVKTLRTTLDKYKDANAAENDGYRPFLPNLPLPEYHFTNYGNGFLEAFTFDPARPTSLLYRKAGGKYELVGAMYTAPKRFSDEQLNARVPLSVAQWHAHVNICMPDRNSPAVDWTIFGFKGTIADEAACKKAGGRFFPQLFGWMVHVYPYEREASRIWRH